MVSDRIESHLNEINDSTQKGLLRWRPISEYIEFYHDNESLTEYINSKVHDDKCNLREKDSFFVKKEDMYLVLLCCEEGNTINHELLGVYHKNAGICKIPPYINGGIESIKDSVLKYWKSKENDYCLSVSDMMEFLKKFHS